MRIGSNMEEDDWERWIGKDERQKKKKVVVVGGGI